MKIDTIWYDCKTAGDVIQPTGYQGQYNCPDPAVFCPEVPQWNSPWPSFVSIVPPFATVGDLVTIVGNGFNSSNVVVYLGPEHGCVTARSTFTLDGTGQLNIKCLIGAKPNALIVRGKNVVDVNMVDDSGKSATGFKAFTLNAATSLFQSSWYLMAGVLVLLVNSMM